MVVRICGLCIGRNSIRSLNAGSGINEFHCPCARCVWYRRRSSASSTAVPKFPTGISRRRLWTLWAWRGVFLLLLRLAWHQVIRSIGLNSIAQGRQFELYKVVKRIGKCCFPFEQILDYWLWVFSCFLHQRIFWKNNRAPASENEYHESSSMVSIASGSLHSGALTWQTSVGLKIPHFPEEIELVLSLTHLLSLSHVFKE